MYLCNKLYWNFIHTTLAHGTRGISAPRNNVSWTFIRLFTVFKLTLNTFVHAHNVKISRIVKRHYVQLKANNGKCHTNSTIGISMHRQEYMQIEHENIELSLAEYGVLPPPVSHQQIYFVFMENSHSQHYYYSNKNISTMQTNCKLCSTRKKTIQYALWCEMRDVKCVLVCSV